MDSIDSIDTDVAIIGAGTAGLAAYRTARAAGRRALLIESGAYGTTCARVGCMPSKLLIAAADAAHGPEKWNEFGLRLEGRVRIDGAAVMARVQRERDRFVGFVLDGVERIPAADRRLGKARFTGDRSLRIEGGPKVRFRSAVIATGSSPAVLPLLRGAGDRLVVNDDVFSWNDLPRSVAVFGPGVIGLELGQALSRLGVEVTVLGRGGRVGPFSDPALLEYAHRTFAGEFSLDADAHVESVDRVDGGVRIVHRNSDRRLEELVVDYVIAATGRNPNVRDLGLENTTLALDASGVPLFDRHTLRCGTSAIFVAGDAANDMPLLHEAADAGRIAGDNAAALPEARPGLRRTPLAIVFTDPQMAVVGQSAAARSGRPVVTGRASFEDQGRSRVMLRNRGLLHVYVAPVDGRVLGAELIGPDAEHLAHLLAWGIESEMTVWRMLEMPFYHPVVAEGLRTALRDAAAQIADRRKAIEPMAA